LRNVQCAHALFPQMASACLMLKRDLQSQRSNVIAQLACIYFDNMIYCMHDNEKCCTKYSHANNCIEFIFITVHVDIPQNSQSLKIDSIDGVGTGLYRCGSAIGPSLLLMRFTAIGTRSDLGMILLIELAGYTHRLCCARIRAEHQIDKHGRKDLFDQRHHSTPRVKTISTRPRGRAAVNPATCGTEPDLPIRPCCAGGGRVSSSRTFVMRKAPPTAAEFDQISVHAIRIALKTHASECRCPFSGRDHERGEHWITIYRLWRQEKIRTEQ
jgi:hypothetical protein